MAAEKLPYLNYNIMNILLIIIIVYVVISLFAYFAHKSLHQKWSGKYNKSHMAHHIALYPADNYLSEKYRDAGKDDAIWFFAIISVPILLLPIILGIIGMPLHLVIISIIEMLFLGYFNNFIHHAYHVKNHWISKVPVINILYRKLQHLHYIHHKYMQKNLGIFDFTWDVLFKTYKK